MADEEEIIDNTGEGDDSGGEGNTAPSLSHPQVFSALVSAIGSFESGSNYDPSGNRHIASGKYQVKNTNIPIWSKEILGRSVTPEQFRKNPALQEQVAQGKLGQYYTGALRLISDPTTAASLVANKWFTGSYFPNDNASDGNTNAANYRKQVLSKMSQNLGGAVQAQSMNIGTRAYTPTPRAMPTPEWLAAHPEEAGLPNGMKAQGNLDPINRKILRNPDGSVSTTSSISIGTNDGEVLIPTVIEGVRLSKDDAIKHYKQTGEHLGIFDSPEAADNYAQALHERQASQLQQANPIPEFLLKRRVDYLASLNQSKPKPPSPLSLGLGVGVNVDMQQNYNYAKAQLAEHPDLSPSERAYQYAIHPGAVDRSQVADAGIVPKAFSLPPLQDIPSISESTARPKNLIPQGVIKAQAQSIDDAALNTAKATGNPVSGATGVFRPYVDKDGSVQAIKSDPNIEERIQNALDERIEATQNSVLSAIAPGLSRVGLPIAGAITKLASQSPVVKAILGTAVEAGNAALVGVPEAIAPKVFHAMEEATISPNSTIGTIQKAVGGLAAIPAIALTGGLAEAGLARLGIKEGLGAAMARTGVTLGATAIPKNIIKVATKQETPGEALTDIGQEALAGAALGAGGSVGSQIAEGANLSRVSSTLVKGTAGAAAMNAPQMLRGEAPDLVSTLQGFGFEALGGWKEFGTKAKDEFLSKTQKNVNDLVKEQGLNKEFTKQEVADAISKNAKDETNGEVIGVKAVADLYKQAGGDAEAADAAVENVKQTAAAEKPVAKEKPIKQKPVDVEAEKTALQQHTETLADTPHELGEYVNDKNLPLEQYTIKTGKNKGKAVDGVIDTELTKDQAEAITNRAPLKATNAGGEEGFFIPKKYVRQTTKETQGNVEEGTSAVKNKPAAEPEAAPVATGEVEPSAGQVRGSEGERGAEIKTQKGEDQNAITKWDIEQSGVEEYIGDNAELRQQGVDRNIASEVAQESASAGNSNSAVAETEKPGLTAKSQLRTPAQTVAWEQSHPDFPLKNGSSMKQIKDYAIQHRVPIRDEAGNNLGFGTLLDKIRDSVDPSDKKALSELSTSGTLHAEVIPGLYAAAKRVGKDAVQFAKEDVVPAIAAAANRIGGITGKMQRTAAPQTMKFTPEEINPRDLHNQHFDFGGKDIRVKSEKQEDGSYENAYYDNSTGKRLVGLPEETKTSLDQAVRKAYTKKVENSARSGANVLRAQGGADDRIKLAQERQLEDVRKHLDKLGEVGGYKMISDIMQDRSVEPELAPIADQIRKIFREEGQRTMDVAKAVGKSVDFNLRDNFFSLLWRPEYGLDKTITQILKTRGYPGGSKYFLKNKVFDDIQQGLDKGLKPMYSNPIDFALHYAAESRKFRAQMQIVKSFKDEGLMRFARTAKDKNIPQGWEKVYGTEINTKTDAGYVHAGDYYAPPGLAQVMKNYYDKGKLASDPLFQTWKTVNNHLNQLQLSLSGFHAGFITTESMISQLALGGEKFLAGINPIHLSDKGKLAFNFTPKYIGEGVKDWLSIPRAAFPYLFEGKNSVRNLARKQWVSMDKSNSMVDYVNHYLESGGHHYAMSNDYKVGGFQSVKQDINSGNIFKMAKGALKSLPATAELPTKLILEKFVPIMKHNAAFDLARWEIEKFTDKHGRDMTPAEMSESARRVVDTIDNRFGLLNYDNLMWNNSFKNILMAVQRSVGWNFGSAREILGGLGDFATAGQRAIQMGVDRVMRREYTGDPIEFTHRMAYSIALPVMTGLMGTAIQVLSGEGFPDDKKDMFFPKTGGTDENGNPARMSLPTYMSDVFNYMLDAGSVLGAAMGESEFHGFRTMGHKVSPALTVTKNLFIDNADYWGNLIRPENAGWFSPEALEGMGKYALEQIKPLGITQILKKLAQGESPIESIAGGFFGLRPAPGRLNKTPMQEFLSERAQAEMSSQPHDRTESKSKEIERHAENLYRAGKDKEANDFLNDPENRKYMSDAHINAAYENSQRFPDRIEKQLHYAKMPDVIRAYFNKASDNELKKYAQVVSDKLQTISEEKLTPEKAAKWYNQITEAEKKGRAKYIDRGELNDVKDVLREAMNPSYKPVDNWNSVVPQIYTAPRQFLPR